LSPARCSGDRFPRPWSVFKCLASSPLSTALVLYGPWGRLSDSCYSRPEARLFPHVPIVSRLPFTVFLTVVFLRLSFLIPPDKGLPAVWKTRNTGPPSVSPPPGSSQVMSLQIWPFLCAVRRCRPPRHPPPTRCPQLLKLRRKTLLLSGLQGDLSSTPSNFCPMAQYLTIFLRVEEGGVLLTKSDFFSSPPAPPHRCVPFLASTPAFLALNQPDFLYFCADPRFSLYRGLISAPSFRLLTSVDLLSPVFVVPFEGESPARC